MIEALFYRARGTWRDAAIRTLTGSDYSHCELIAPRQTGPVVETIAASKRDGSVVRLAQIDTGTGHWDRLSFRGDPDTAWQRILPMLGEPYDMWGAVLSATALARPRDGRWFCSELIAHAVGMRDPHEFSPGMLAAAAMRNSRGAT